MYYKGYYINVVLLDETFGVKGSVRHNSDDSYTIFLDSSLNNIEMKSVFNHEMFHIENNDFEKENIQEIEFNAHKINKLMMEEQYETD